MTGENASLRLYLAEYPGFSRAQQIAQTMPQTSRAKVERKLDRPDIFLGEVLRLRIADDCGVGTDAICVGEYGKPYFEPPNDAAFNISHSGRIAVGALLFSGGDVGVDVERIDKNGGTRKERIADRFFTAKERAVIDGADDPVREFYLTWTRKEAYVKYTGTGITCPLEDIDTTCVSGVTIASRVIVDGEKNEYAFSICASMSARDMEDKDLEFTKIF